jgi:hypothetical protein
VAVVVDICPVGRAGSRAHRFRQIGQRGSIDTVAEPVMSTFETPRLDCALNESWPPDAATTPDRTPVQVPGPGRTLPGGAYGQGADGRPCEDVIARLSDPA